VLELDASVPIFREVRERLRRKIADVSSVRHFVGPDTQFVHVDAGVLVA